MTTSPLSSSMTAAEFDALVQANRPDLLRYAARMTGSVVDGEDVVQEALIKASDSLPLLTHQTNVRGWLFRITHHKAVDHLRRFRNEPLDLLDEHPMTDLPDAPLEEKELTTFALSLFLKLAPRQRSCVILKDVMGYSLAEISELLNATVPEIKATLHRGRTRLRDLAGTSDTTPPPLNERERERLALFVDRFNQRDFATLRTMLSEDAGLDLVQRAKLQGAEAINNRYFNGYDGTDDWQFVVGLVEGNLGIIAYDLTVSTSEPAYFILLTWVNESVSFIRDYRYARQVMTDAAITLL